MKKSRVLYRLGGEQVVHCIEGEAEIVSSLDHDVQGFLIAPFRADDQHPVVLIRPTASCSCKPEEAYRMWSDGPVCEPAPMKPRPMVEENQSWHRAYPLFMEALRRKEFDKLVLSTSFRIKERELSGATAGYVDWFRRAANGLSHGLAYLFDTPYTGTWVGATPEVLMEGRGDEWHTMALAGTKHPGEAWDSKNRHEQQLVADYIASLLPASFSASEPRTLQAGRLQHLCTDFRFRMDSRELFPLLQRLHPTPAVCGLPKEKAMQFIQQNEGYDRCYYAGYLGPVGIEGESHLYVNIRCGNVAPDGTAVLYAGSGLVEDSLQEKEWAEVQDKAATLLCIKSDEAHK